MTYWLLLFLEFLLLFGTSRHVSVSLSRLFLNVTRSQKVSVALLALLFFPGVVVHELSHFLAAGLLLVRANHIEFLPEIREKGVKLGSVSISQTDPARRFLIGVAPLLAGLSLIGVLLYYLFSSVSLLEAIQPLWVRMAAYGGIIYGIFTITNTMFSSRRDMEGAIELVIITLLLGLTLYLVKPELIRSAAGFLFSHDALAREAAFFLAIPLAINIVSVGTLHFLLKRGL